MTESVVADFVARFAIQDGSGVDPVRGRVVLGEHQLVLAASADERVTIPLDAIFDVGVGDVPRKLDDFFDTSIVVGFERGESRHTAVIEADHDVVERFTTALFKTTLNGASGIVVHPARIGGRVTDADERPAVIYLTDDGMRFKTAAGEPFTIAPAAVIGFQRDMREFDDGSRQVLVVRHLQREGIVTSVLTLESSRKLALLGRYLRLEYGDTVADLRDMDLPTPEQQTLYALYSGADGATLATMVDIDASQITTVLASLAEKGLVTDPGDATLTAKGKIAASEFVEDVNV
jgi:helix-turn-helix protein